MAAAVGSLIIRNIVRPEMIPSSLGRLKRSLRVYVLIVNNDKEKKRTKDLYSHKMTNFTLVLDSNGQFAVLVDDFQWLILISVCG